MSEKYQESRCHRIIAVTFATLRFLIAQATSARLVWFSARISEISLSSIIARLRWNGLM